MMHAAGCCFVESRHWLSSQRLASRCVDEFDRDGRVDGLDRLLDHLAALVLLGDDPVGFVKMKRVDGCLRPFERRPSSTLVVDDEAVVALLGADDDAVLIARRRDRRVDGDDDAFILAGCHGQSSTFDPVSFPQCAFDVFE